MYMYVCIYIYIYIHIHILSITYTMCKYIDMSRLVEPERRPGRDERAVPLAPREAYVVSYHCVLCYHTTLSTHY